MTGRLLPCGDTAVLVEVAGLDDVLALAARVRAAVGTRRPGFAPVADVVPAARTLLVVVERSADLPGLRRALSGLLSEPAEAAPGPGADGGEVVRIEVTYDGPDLDRVAELTGLSTAEVVAAHTGTPWRVAFGGFAPGFAYLAGGDPRLEVPRREEPRTSVPAGAVGLAGTYSGVYPRSSPGGWQLIGRTDAVLWDVDRDPPALLRPGAGVQFVEAGAQA